MKDTQKQENPNKNKKVEPTKLCEFYEPREGAIRSLRGCWFCRYADFHLFEEKPLEIGVCRWPERML